MKAMIISVGGTPEPIVASLLEHRPEYVCFLASQQSMDILGQVKNKAKSQGLRFEDYKVLCEDAESLIECYVKAVDCAEKIAHKAVYPSEVVVDYTGGTKTMTAALALATVGHGFSFSYVGGKERTKEGLGVVVTGREVVKEGVSPWRIFAVEEKKRISLFVSSFQYEAAISTFQQTADNLQDREKEIWSGICESLEGYLAWDNFDHKIASRCLKRGLQKLDVCEKFGLEKSVRDYVYKSKSNFETLCDIERETKSFKTMHPILVLDLVSNARRRYLQNKYDDAVARLYRALEMVGQIDFEAITGCSTSDADPSRLPDTIRDEYVRKFQSPDDQKVKIPLFGVFNALKEMNHPTGHKYFENELVFKKILSARNSSILAHGNQPIKKETYTELSKIIESLFVEGPLIEFPELNW